MSVVQRGAVNVHRVSAVGKEQMIHVFRTGDSFAEVALASATGYPADARALEPTQVLLVQKDEILALLKRQPELALRMIGSMSSHIRVLVSQLEDLTLKDVETRLANWLMKRCPNPQSEQPMKIELTMTSACWPPNSAQSAKLFPHVAKLPRAKAPHRQRQNHRRAVSCEAECAVAAQFGSDDALRHSTLQLM